MKGRRVQEKLGFTKHVGEIFSPICLGKFTVYFKFKVQGGVSGCFWLEDVRVSEFEDCAGFSATLAYRLPSKGEPHDFG